jgi:hypothetical protein
MITGTCDTCGQASSVVDHLAGLTIRCKLCGKGWIALPRPARAEPAVSEVPAKSAITPSVPTAPERSPVTQQPKPGPAPVIAAPKLLESSEAPNTTREAPGGRPVPNLMDPAFDIPSEPKHEEPWPARRRLGVWMLVLGLGSFVLPLFGLQFRLLRFAGDSQWIAGTVLAIIGGLLVAWSYMDED